MPDSSKTEELFLRIEDSIMALEKERETYERKRQELLRDEGKFVVIHGDEIAGVWDTWESALNAGYGQYGLNPFMVQRIEAVDTVLRPLRYTSCR
jgi:hypothetical protein